MAKKSTAYRTWRHQLACVAPTDVWSDPDEDAYIVIFSTERTSLPDHLAAHPLQAFLAFVVDRSAFALRDAGVLAVEMEDENWTISNHGVPTFNAEEVK